MISWIIAGVLISIMIVMTIVIRYFQKKKQEENNESLNANELKNQVKRYEQVVVMEKDRETYTQEVINEILYDYSSDINKYAEVKRRKPRFIVASCFAMVVLAIGAILGCGGISILLGLVAGVFTYFISWVWTQNFSDSSNKKFFEKLARKIIPPIERNDDMDLIYFKLMDAAGLHDNGALSVFCIQNKIDYSVAHEAYKRGARIAGENALDWLKKDTEEFERESYAYKGLPLDCPACGKKLWGDAPKKWEVVASTTLKGNAFDSAYTIGGVTTVFNKEVRRTVKQYKCPYCGYTHIC